MRKYGLGLLALTAALFSLASSARADLSGDTVDVQYLYPTSTSLVANVGTTSVPGTISYSEGGSAITISISGDLVTISAIGSAGVDFSSASFNGFSIADITQNPDITGVEYLSGSSLVPSNFSTSDITFNSDEVFFNFEGQNWCNCDGATYTAEFQLSFGTSTNAVPEPPTVALLGAAVAALGLFAVRRRAHMNGLHATAA